MGDLLIVETSGCRFKCSLASIQQLVHQKPWVHINKLSEKEKKQKIRETLKRTRKPPASSRCCLKSSCKTRLLIRDVKPELISDLSPSSCPEPKISSSLTHQRASRDDEHEFTPKKKKKPPTKNVLPIVVKKEKHDLPEKTKAIDCNRPFTKMLRSSRKTKGEQLSDTLIVLPEKQTDNTVVSIQGCSQNVAPIKLKRKWVIVKIKPNSPIPFDLDQKISLMGKRIKPYCTFPSDAITSLTSQKTNNDHDITKNDNIRDKLDECSTGTYVVRNPLSLEGIEPKVSLVANEVSTNRIASGDETDGNETIKSRLEKHRSSNREADKVNADRANINTAKPVDSKDLTLRKRKLRSSNWEQAKVNEDNSNTKTMESVDTKGLTLEEKTLTPTFSILSGSTELSTKNNSIEESNNNNCHSNFTSVIKYCTRSPLQVDPSKETNINTFRLNSFKSEDFKTGENIVLQPGKPDKQNEINLVPVSVLPDIIVRNSASSDQDLERTVAQLEVKCVSKVVSVPNIPEIEETGLTQIYEKKPDESAENINGLFLNNIKLKLDKRDKPTCNDCIVPSKKKYRIFVSKSKINNQSVSEKISASKKDNLNAQLRYLSEGTVSTETTSKVNVVATVKQSNNVNEKDLNESLEHSGAVKPSSLSNTAFTNQTSVIVRGINNCNVSSIGSTAETPAKTPDVITSSLISVGRVQVDEQGGTDTPILAKENDDQQKNDSPVKGLASRCLQAADVSSTCKVTAPTDESGILRYVLTAKSAKTREEPFIIINNVHEANNCVTKMARLIIMVLEKLRHVIDLQKLQSKQPSCFLTTQIKNACSSSDALVFSVRKIVFKMNIALLNMFSYFHFICSLFSKINFLGRKKFDFLALDENSFINLYYNFLKADQDFFRLQQTYSVTKVYDVLMCFLKKRHSSPTRFTAEHVDFFPYSGTSNRMWYQCALHLNTGGPSSGGKTDQHSSNIIRTHKDQPHTIHYYPTDYRLPPEITIPCASLNDVPAEDFSKEVDTILQEDVPISQSPKATTAYEELNQSPTAVLINNNQLHSLHYYPKHSKSQQEITISRASLIDIAAKDVSKEVDTTLQENVLVRPQPKATIVTEKPTAVLIDLKHMINNRYSNLNSSPIQDVGSNTPQKVNTQLSNQYYACMNSEVSETEIPSRVNHLCSTEVQPHSLRQLLPSSQSLLTSSSSSSLPPSSSSVIEHRLQLTPNSLVLPSTNRNFTITKSNATSQNNTAEETQKGGSKHNFEIIDLYDSGDDSDFGEKRIPIILKAFSLADIDDSHELYAIRKMWSGRILSEDFDALLNSDDISSEGSPELLPPITQDLPLLTNGSQEVSENTLLEETLSPSISTTTSGSEKYAKLSLHSSQVGICEINNQEVSEPDLDEKPTMNTITSLDEEMKSMFRIRDYIKKEPTLNNVLLGEGTNELVPTDEPLHEESIDTHIKKEGDYIYRIRKPTKEEILFYHEGLRLEVERNKNKGIRESINEEPFSNHVRLEGDRNNTNRMREPLNEEPSLKERNNLSIIRENLLRRQNTEEPSSNRSRLEEEPNNIFMLFMKTLLEEPHTSHDVLNGEDDEEVCLSTSFDAESQFLLEDVHACVICGKEADMMCCGCKTTAYCSTDCQTFDWKGGHFMHCIRKSDV